MFHLHKYPFIRIVIPYALGIWVAWQTVFNIPITAIIAILALLLAAAWIVAKFIKTYSLRWVYGVLISLLLFFIGSYQVEIRRLENQANHFMHHAANAELYVARIKTQPQQRAKSVKLQLDLVSIYEEGQKKDVDGKIIAYLPLSSTDVHYGDLLIFSKEPQELEPPHNPYQFDYKSYLARSGIAHQLFLKEDEWQVVGKGYTNPLYSFAFRLRGHLLEALQKYGLDGDEYHVASAILLGYDDQLPGYLRQSYTAAGGMHVLCVSGLHVGIVYLFFSFLLRFPGKNKNARLFKTVILLLIIWFYALLTGLAPSVIRAAIMFSFMLIGQSMQRKAYILNTLAASAFLILLFDPLTLYHIGFQLSYSAVIGIVSLQKPIYRSIYIKNTLLDKAWEAISVTLAAQLATTAFVLHYFGQFPTYFIISNLILAPLSFLIITIGMTLLLFSFIPFLASIVGWALSGLIYLMNYLITGVESLPYAVFQSAYISPGAAMFLSIAIIILFVLISYSNKKLIFPLLASFAMFLLLVTQHHIENLRQSKIIIYGIPQRTVIDFVSGKNHFLYADTTNTDIDFVFDFYVKNNWKASGLKSPIQIISPDHNTSHSFLFKQDAIMLFGARKIALWSIKDKEVFVPTSKLKVDYVLVSGNSPEQLEVIQKYYDFDWLVFDLSLPIWHLNTWKTEAADKQIAFYDIREQGAFIITP